MNAQRPIRYSASMQQAIADDDAGAVVRLVRRAADLTQAELGAAVGYTAASISRMERGKQPMRDVVLLRRIATALDIPPHLLGLASRHEETTSRGNPPSHLVRTTKVSAEPMSEEGEDPVRRRNLLAGMAGVTTAVLGPATAASAGPERPSLSGLEDLLLYRRLSDVAAPQEPAPSAVTTAVETSRLDFGTCRYDRLARALPSRIALAQALGSDGMPEQSASAVAELYNIATRLCIKLGKDNLAAVTADRALTAALNGADALTAAESHRMVSSVWRRAGHLARATDVAVHAAERLASESSIPEAERLSVQGDLYATAAYTAAKQGNRHSAKDLITEAEDIAARLGRDDTRRGSVFGPGQVRLHQISVCHLLGDAGHAVEHARRVDAGRLPNQERRARYWVDVARAFGQWDKPDRCYRALLAAEQAAPQEVRRSSVQEVTAALMCHDRKLPGVRAFASRTGALGQLLGSF